MIAGSQKLVSGTMGAIGSGPNHHRLSICLSNPQCSVKDNFAEFWLNLVKIVPLSLSPNVASHSCWFTILPTHVEHFNVL